MKEYKIQAKSTNGFWTEQGYKEFESEGEAKTFANNKSRNTGFEFRAVFVRELATPKQEEVKDEVEEQVEVETEDNQVETQTEEVETEVEETEDVEQIDYDFEDSHDEDNFPRGWWLQKEFVAKDGTVFRLKKEQPELYRTKKPSKY